MSWEVFGKVDIKNFEEDVYRPYGWSTLALPSARQRVAEVPSVVATAEGAPFGERHECAIVMLTHDFEQGSSRNLVPHEQVLLACFAGCGSLVKTGTKNQGAIAMVKEEQEQV